MVVISGQVQSHLIGEDAFQETDMVGISRPIVKHSFMVQRTEDIPKHHQKGVLHRDDGSTRALLLSTYPKDLTHPEHKFDYAYPQTVSMRSYQPSTKRVTPDRFERPRDCYSTPSVQ